MVKELIPMIDRTYRTDRRSRSPRDGGISMGGMQTMAIALTHLDMFSYIGTFSGAQFVRTALTASIGVSRTAPFDPKTSYGGVFADADAFNSKVRLLWMGAGTAELRLSESLRENADKLRAAEHQGYGVSLSRYCP